MERKVLVTGASGLIGRELCKQLHSEGYYVVAVDNGFRYKHVPFCDEFVKQSIVDFTSTTENDYDFIFHMGAINGTKYFYDMPNTLIENNITSDLAIFNFTKQNKDCKVIYGSSSEIVAGTDVFPTSELTDISIKDIHNPRWSYRLGKIVSENYLTNSDLDYLIIRFFNIFGQASGDGHFVRDIINKLRTDDYSLVGAAETRSFCRVEDAVDAIMNIFKIAHSEVINVGSPEEITVLDAAEIIAEHLNVKPQWKFIPGNKGSVSRRKPDIKKLLKYYPTFNPAKFKDAIKDL
jgi:UDP-glucose 4-epimerase